MPRIVIAFDGSDQARKTLDALDWFDRSSLSVLLVSVVDGPALDANGDAVSADPEEMAHAQAMTRQIVGDMAPRGIDVEVRIEVGQPAEAVIAVAREVKADLIMTGCRGLGLAQRIVFGSVSSAILADAPCPVVVVR